MLHSCSRKEARTRGPLSFCLLPLGRAYRRRSLPAWPRPAPRGALPASRRGGGVVSLPLPAAARMAAQLPAPAKNRPLPVAEKRLLTKGGVGVRVGMSGSVSLNVQIWRNFNFAKFAFGEMRTRASTKKKSGPFFVPRKGHQNAKTEQEERTQTQWDDGRPATGRRALLGAGNAAASHRHARTGAAQPRGAGPGVRDAARLECREHRGAAHRAAGYAGRVRTAWPERGRAPWMKAA